MTTQSQEPSHSLLHAIWFGRQAVEDGFVDPEAFARELFLYVANGAQGAFVDALQEAGLLTAFQSKKLSERIGPLPIIQTPIVAAETTQGRAEGQGSAEHPGAERYWMGEIIQQGGSGRIYRAYDKVIGREVALKCLREPGQVEVLRRFENEYRITGGLDHPNIISVHDASVSKELGPFYVMRLLQGQTLREVLRQAHEIGLPGRTALLRIFLDVCAAVAYAHSRGILHRDLKPSNIMVGELGEVQVMDWGIAMRLRDAILPTPPAYLPEDASVDLASLALPSKPGEILGTPGYMAPEQARGERQIDERADIFALGCVLYEMLVNRFPFQGDQLHAYLGAIGQGPPRAPSSFDPSISEELDEIVMRALEVDPAQRYASVRELSAALGVHLEGTRTQKLRQQRALSKVMEGMQARTQMQEHEAEAQQILGELRGEEAQIRPHDPIEKKRPLWEKEQRIEQLEKEAMVRLGESISALTQALALDPESQEAHSQLADLYYERLLAAERRRDLPQMAYQESMLKRHNDGRYDRFLQNQGTIWLLSDPPGATVTIHALREVERILQPDEGTVLGETPLGPITLPAGSYLAVFERKGDLPTRVPVLVQREQSGVYRARMYRTGDIPEGFCYIPQGHFLLGGDPLTASAGRTERPFVPDLLVATLPVTIAQYLEFLNAAPAPDAMRPHSPRRSPDGGFYLQQEESGLWVLPDIDEDGDSWNPDWPVFAISWYDALAYAQWMAQTHPMPYRLPLSFELEKAARGVDGRYYPWGDRFDATFCKMGKSRPGPPKPEAVGEYVKDISVYGVRDLGGGIREWCGDEVDAPDGALAFGGNWSGSELTSRAAHRWYLQKGQVAPGIGMRLAMDAPCLPYHQGFEEVPSESATTVSLTTSHRIAPPPSSLSLIREKLADPRLWSALTENRDEWVLTQLALAALASTRPWALIQAVDEDIPLATAGDAPETVPRSILEPFYPPETRHTPSASVLDDPISLSLPAPALTVLPCGSPVLGFLILPQDAQLSISEQQSLCSAISLALKRRREQKQSLLREKQTSSEVAEVRKELTIVREALATVAPDTYLRENYPLIDGRSPAMRRLLHMLDRIVQSEVNVLIRGESGVGKERVARTIHQNGASAHGPFVAVNCGALPENLVESELFGYTKGAFTGALKDHPGLFREAHQGTLFLDEVAELSLDAQVKLLRALQNRAVRPVGGVTEYPFQARILAATHKDLKQCVKEGTFRDDLYWRLVVMEIEIPPLRERPEDIPVLLARLLSDWQQEVEISNEAMQLLQAYPWPGNVRELENELRRALVVAERQIHPSHLSTKLRSSSSHKASHLQGTLRDIIAQVESDAIQFALQQAQGNKSEAARKLGLSKRGFQLKMQRYHLEPPSSK